MTCFPWRRPPLAIIMPTLAKSRAMKHLPPAARAPPIRSTVMYPDASAPNGFQSLSLTKSAYLIPVARSRTQASRSVFGET